MIEFAEPIHKAVEANDAAKAPQRRPQRRSMPSDLAVDTHALRQFTGGRMWSIIGVCIAQMVVSMPLVALSVCEAVRPRSHAAPVNIYLPDGFSLTTALGGFEVWQCWFRLAAAATVLANDGAIVAYAALERRLVPNPAALSRCSRRLGNFPLLLVFGLLAALFAYFTAADAAAVARTARHTAASASPPAAPLPDVVCCGVDMDAVWVARLLEATSHCYNGTDAFDCSGFIGVTVLDSPAALVSFTCSQVLCTGSEYVIVCVLDGLLLLLGVLAILIVACWGKKTTVCDVCGKIVQKRPWWKAHDCRFKAADACVFCGALLREVDRAAHLRRCWFEQTQAQLDHEARGRNAAGAPFPPVEMQTLGAGPRRGPQREGPGKGTLAPPLLRGGCAGPPDPDPAYGEEQRRYLESQSLLAAPPPAPAAPPLAVGPGKTETPTKSRCCYCHEDIGSKPLAEHLTHSCSRFLVPCADCAAAVVYRDRARHDATCPLRMCPCRACGSLVAQADLRAHERAECAWRVVGCARCGAELCARDRPTHDPACPGAAACV